MLVYRDLIFIIVAIVIALVEGVVCYFVGYKVRKATAEKEIKSAETEATRILNEAIKTAESKKRELLVEAKEEILKLRNETEKELKERRAELQKQERRLDQKEENIDKKQANMEEKEELIAKRLKEAEEQKEEIRAIKKGHLDMLEKISGYTSEEAKKHLLEKLDDEIKHESAVRIKDMEANLKEEADTKARELISLAIQKVAADHVAEATVSVVPLPSDEMKGRIIGREGRNIRTLETLTGVDLIIDDTPEAITLSSFDPVRREVARLSLEKLIVDGRIHPARIEETVEKAKKEVDAIIKQEGEKAVFDVAVHGIHPDLIKTLGRMKYRTSYGQNVLKHSMEVAHIAGQLASELGINPLVARRAGLLHDLGKAVDHEIEGSHVMIGVDLARKYKESEEIIHAIHAHHGDVEAQTALACIVQAADAISAARPGARRENIQAYIKRLEKLEELANSFTGVEKSFAIQAGREVRIIVKPEDVSDDNMILLARDLAKKIEEDLAYPGQIKVHVVRETRAIEYAK